MALSSSMFKGKIIAFEGMDCCFKETNYYRFVNKLNKGFTNTDFIETQSFPRYNHPSSYFIKNFLNNSYDRDYLKNNPRILTDMYALDRYDFWNFHVFNNPTLLDVYKNKEKCFIFDRYTLSAVMYHPMFVSGNLISAPSFTYEKDVFNIPLPTVVLFLYCSDFNILKSLIEKKNKKDSNETDIEYLASVYDNVKNILSTTVAKDVGIDIIPINILQDGSIRSENDIADEVWSRLSLYLIDKYKEENKDE